MNKTQFDRAVTFNSGQLGSNALTSRHITAMTAAWQETHDGLVVDGMCGPLTRASIEAATADMLTPPVPAPPPTTPPAPTPPLGPVGVEFFDRRAFARQAHGSSGQWPVRDRPLSSVTGMCLHQTACILGERVERWDTAAYHFGITRAGKVIWLHGFDRLTAHGNGWNNGTIGIGIDGLYAGVEGDPSTVWDDPSTPHREQGLTLTPATIHAALSLGRWIRAQLGDQMRALVSHRQSSVSRRACPGSAIWDAIALPLHQELGMSDGGIGFRLGDGRAIPEVWDPRCVGIRY